MTNLKELSNIERIENLLKFVESSQRVSVDTICRNYQVSKATARRDLDILSKQGKIQRIHGGAIALRNAPPENPVYQRKNLQMEIKQKIGLAASKLIQEGETIFLGSGTTVLEVAHNLIHFSNLKIITNSLLVINMLSDYPNIELIILGGMLRHSELSLIGYLTDHAISELHADKVIMGIHSISYEKGLTNDYPQETITDRNILKMTTQVIVVADHTKFGRISTAYVAPINVIDTLITDNETSPDFIEKIIEQGVKVIMV
jgi:DeoR/GlpR family transcriptional regulator of sugar metabolism